MILNPVYAQTAEFKRPTGPTTFTTLGTNPVVVSVAPTVSVKDSEDQESGRAFTPRGLDRREGDRFTYNGVEYSLFGVTRGDHDQPFTGDDFGWVVHSLRREAPFGSQTVTFVAVAQSGDPGYLGLKAKSRTETAVTGCLFEPVLSSETPDAQTNVATGIWLCTAPPVAASIAANSTGELKVGGVTYQIDGPAMPKFDRAGAIHKVLILCKRQVG